MRCADDAPQNFKRVFLFPYFPILLFLGRHFFFLLEAHGLEISLSLFAIGRVHKVLLLLRQQVCACVCERLLNLL
jgi:hypothetical protein